eukprot:6888026-Lingulodinium_polyedra.AAC.1
MATSSRALRRPPSGFGWYAAGKYCSTRETAPRWRAVSARKVRCANGCGGGRRHGRKRGRRKCP